VIEEVRGKEEAERARTGAWKFDGYGTKDAKLRYDLIPPECIEEVAKVYTMGCAKYGDDNWQSLDNFENRYYGALMRHLIAYRQGKSTDSESGLLHLSHAAWNIFALIWKERQK